MDEKPDLLKHNKKREALLDFPNNYLAEREGNSLYYKVLITLIQIFSKLLLNRFLEQQSDKQ